MPPWNLSKTYTKCLRDKTQFYYKRVKQKNDKAVIIIQECLLNFHELFNHILRYRHIPLFINTLYNTTFISIALD